MFNRASPVQQAIQQAMGGRSATTPLFHVTRNVFWDDVPDTYRFHLRDGNGWVRLLTANARTKEVYEVQAKDPSSVTRIQEALKALGIPGRVEWRDGQAVYERGEQTTAGSVHEVCPYCEGKLFADWSRCPWCDADISTPAVKAQAGDRIRVRNPFKGNRVEDVTVVRVLHGGWALEVRDQRGLVWGYLKPRDIITAAGAG